jgi:nucleotide-binding universal stress UspA family protein
MVGKCHVSGSAQVFRLRDESDYSEDSEESTLSSIGNVGAGPSGNERIVASDGETEYRLLVPVLNNERVEDIERLVQTASLIVDDREGTILVLCLVTLPKQTPYESLANDADLVSESRETAEKLLQIAIEQGVSADALVCLTHRGVQSVLNIIDQYACDGIIMKVSADRTKRRRLLSGSAVEKIMARAECDVFVETIVADPTPVESIYLPVSDRLHSGIAAKTACVLARTSGARIDAIHFLSEQEFIDGHQQTDEIIQVADALSTVEHTVSTIILTEQVGEDIITRSDEYDVTVLGAPTRGLLKQFVFGTVPDSVRQRENAVLMAKRATRASLYNRWFIENT